MNGEEKDKLIADQDKRISDLTEKISVLEAQIEAMDDEAKRSISLFPTDVLIKDRDDIIFLRTSDVVTQEMKMWIEKQFNLILAVVSRLEPIPDGSKQ